MHLITCTTTQATQPTATVSGTAGWFQPGNIATNLPATQVTYDWLNTIQAEIGNVITNATGGNTTLSLTNDGQLLTAIKLIVSNAVGAIQAVPVGSIHNMAMATVPTGYLYCDGTAVSRSTYSNLFSAIGTTYGVGNGTTTFNLPDFRGVFLRGLDSGRGLDPSRAIGTYQADNLGSHTHTVTMCYYDNHKAGGGGGDNGTTGYWNYTNTTAATGGAETAPKNVAVYTVIKY